MSLYNRYLATKRSERNQTSFFALLKYDVTRILFKSFLFTAAARKLNRMNGEKKFVDSAE